MGIDPSGMILNFNPITLIRSVINKVVDFLLSDDMSNSKKLLKRSVNGNTEKLIVDRKSSLAIEVRKSEEFNNNVDKIIEKNIHMKEFHNKKSLLTFNNGDLFGSLHNCTLTLNGFKMEDERWFVTAVVTDTYDFDTSLYKNNFNVGFGNNAAFALQKLNIAKKYDIYIEYAFIYE